jgi:hypothetical protein
LYKLPFKFICSVLLETNASEAIGPIGWYEDPKANCPFAVAAARAPNITEPE